MLSLTKAVMNWNRKDSTLDNIIIHVIKNDTELYEQDKRYFQLQIIMLKYLCVGIMDVL